MRVFGVVIDRVPLAGLAFELVAALGCADAPQLRGLFDTAALPAHLPLLLPLPVAVWGASEPHRQLVRPGAAYPIPPVGDRL